MLHFLISPRWRRNISIEPAGMLQRRSFRRPINRYLSYTNAFFSQLLPLAFPAASSHRHLCLISLLPCVVKLFGAFHFLSRQHSHMTGILCNLDSVGKQGLTYITLLRGTLRGYLSATSKLAQNAILSPKKSIRGQRSPPASHSPAVSSWGSASFLHQKW